jgi:hypothetical protein
MFCSAAIIATHWDAGAGLNLDKRVHRSAGVGIAAAFTEVAPVVEVLASGDGALGLHPLAASTLSETLMDAANTWR